MPSKETTVEFDSRGNFTVRWPQSTQFQARLGIRNRRVVPYAAALLLVPSLTHFLIQARRGVVSESGGIDSGGLVVVFAMSLILLLAGYLLWRFGDDYNTSWIDAAGVTSGPESMRRLTRWDQLNDIRIGQAGGLNVIYFTSDFGREDLGYGLSGPDAEAVVEAMIALAAQHEAAHGHA